MQNDEKNTLETERKVRILHVEDDSHDRELVAEALRAEGLKCDIVCVASESEFRAALDRCQFDVILSDFSVPLFDGAGALAVAKACRAGVPFLYVSGTIGEERAVEELKGGATDYVLKDRLERLGPAVRRALSEARERAEHIRAELRVRQLNRTYAVSSAINQLILRGGEPQDVLHSACRIAVEKGDFRMAWIGMLDATGQSLKPRASAGVAEGYLDMVNIDLRDAVRSACPSARALLSGEYQISNDIRNDPLMRPWRSAALERNYLSTAAFPLMVAGKSIGVFVFYATEPDFFDTDELRLLDELAKDIAFALESCQREQERRQAIEQLRASEERFRELAETIQEVFWITNPAKNQMLYISPAYEKIWGRSCQSLYDKPGSWLEAIHPEDAGRVRQAAAAQYTGNTYDVEYRIIRPDMEIRWIRDVAFPVRNNAGQVERVVGVARDVTERREMAEQLRQSQKMEAVGQLAGGVAHDFNNILAAVMLQAKLSANVENTPKEVQDGLLQIHAAAERAADLIRQLLLFSRKQVMQARTLDLNKVVTSLAKMLQRIIGEDVRLQLHLHSAPLITHADAGMLDQVLINLAVNSRDAMPGGGQLLIQTTETNMDQNFARLNPEAKPGKYVCLSVSDTGTGISPENLLRIFEPFFTTKEPGKGTGLGLATVFGIVKQHGGFIRVESEHGHGARFEILLPASPATPESLARVAERQPRGGTETILLVEDDEGVRTLVRAMLERHGYRVLAAADGVQAIKFWEGHRGTVALLLTDLVMPGGISGQELASQLQQDKPQLKVVFTSGYSAEVAGRQIELQLGGNFLQKPFPPDQLLETIRRCLDD
ncbi:MAG TPA: response regulator [Verrucomicrobiae bacterium]|nr:response regulator [Verrucomicrobiae bacterium]